MCHLWSGWCDHHDFDDDANDGSDGDGDTDDGGDNGDDVGDCCDNNLYDDLSLGWLQLKCCSMSNSLLLVQCSSNMVETLWMKLEHDFDDKEINKDDFHRKTKVAVKAGCENSQSRAAEQPGQITTAPTA